MSEQNNEYSIKEIEELINSFNTKLPVIKKVAKQLKINVTQKKDDLLAQIEDVVYDVERFIKEQMDLATLRLKEKEEKDKGGKDYWLHKFTKYGVKDNYYFEIHEKNIYENYEKKYNFHFSLISKESRDIQDQYNGFINIKSKEDADKVKQFAEENEIEVVFKSNILKTEIERIADVNLIKKIVGIGAMCMQSIPCVHGLKFRGFDDKIYNARYAGYRLIREALLNEMDEENLPEHFMKKK